MVKKKSHCRLPFFFLHDGCFNADLTSWGFRRFRVRGHRASWYLFRWKFREHNTNNLQLQYRLSKRIIQSSYWGGFIGITYHGTTTQHSKRTLEWNGPLSRYKMRQYIKRGKNHWILTRYHLKKKCSSLSYFFSPNNKATFIERMICRRQWRNKCVRARAMQ